MSVKLGINPITWTNDDVPELGGDTPLETCLAETALAGYRGTELGGKFPREVEALRAVLDRHGLELVSGWWDGRINEREIDAELEATLPHLTLLRELGAEIVVYADTSGGRHDDIWQPHSRRPRLADDEWDHYGEKLTALANRFAVEGVGLALHHHMGTVVQTDEEVDRLMEVTGPSVGLLFDSGHSAFAGGDPVSLARRHADRIVHVHCKDVRADVLERALADDMSFMDAVLAGIFTVPGDGAIDYSTIFAALADAGYEGWLVVEAEQDPAKANPLTYATRGHDNLRLLALEAGLEVDDQP
ncbi:MAG: myo-inosose-2 dehydratase [Actinomycetia bacterium]|nr:myo-inosose-2 dehydratase [Actinomycetes bacterium]MCP5035728.1 myo-inosose-2 dehydratase [Actinomycetes bacterium]